MECLSNYKIANATARKLRFTLNHYNFGGDLGWERDGCLGVAPLMDSNSGKCGKLTGHSTMTGVGTECLPP
jgi:hypothetical protein